MFRKTVVLFFAIALCSCNSSKKESVKVENQIVDIVPTKKLYSANEFDSLIKNNPLAVLVDVRTSEEFLNGHLENALNLDWKGTEFSKQLDAIDKDQTILVYCLSGGRSGQAATAMREKGYKNVLELDGGILAWRSQNLPEVAIKENSEGMTLESYNKLINSDKMVLVDFNAVWCAPCKKMKPFIDKIENDFKNKVLVIKIDVDENASLSKALKVSGLPALKLYKNGEVVWQHTGYATEQEIVSQINK